MVADGKLPGRPGIRRVIAAATDAGWRLAVASTSAEPSVRAVLEHAAGPELARDVAVLAGDIVPAKKPAPDIYQLAVRDLAADPARTVVVEDSRNGLLAASGAGLPALDHRQRLHRGRGLLRRRARRQLARRPDGEPATVLANRTAGHPRRPRSN